MKGLIFILIGFMPLFRMARAQNVLPIPPLYKGELQNGAVVFDLEMKPGETDFFPDDPTKPKTPTAGYNGSFLGPTLLMQKEDSVVLNVTNNLGEETTTHWHGFHIPAKMDGGPQQKIPDATTWQATFRILNRASTYWYHPHMMPPMASNGSVDWSDPRGTGGQVYRGLAGMIIIEDEEANALNLPHTYGLDDIPLIFTDRAFNEDGTFEEFYLGDEVRIRKGNTPIVNGAITPSHGTPAQMIRFRLLNASNGRIYYFGLNDNRVFHQIGSDGGLLTSPVALTRLRLSPGERADIIIDFSADQGKSIQLMSFASELNEKEAPVPEVMRDAMDITDYNLVTFNVVAPGNDASAISTLPSSLIDIALYDPNEAKNNDEPRRFELISEGRMSINHEEMDINVINETVNLGDMEVWEIVNTSGQAHPFHIHGDSFQVIYISDEGEEIEIPENERGWKDVVLVPGAARGHNGVVRVIKPFLDFADPEAAFMYHCHILEHEDLGMMGQFVVVDNGSTDDGDTDNGDDTITGSDDLNDIEPGLRIYPNPTESQLHVSFATLVSGLYTLKLSDGAGQEISVWQLNNLNPGEHDFELDLQYLLPAVYILTIESRDQVLSKKLIKL
ncbi:multicopper oxidase domain-containing protein [Xanthovirga aplysinae]|uniref:multicopper oxidase domain-containing protein n=1 Tax=Xanthovirga aplysinae TaxID=2529853 RepID=UPI001656D2B9|nr:multicopper oxidase domain-containing protein [Xanthovirga aplysinae]